MVSTREAQHGSQSSKEGLSGASSLPTVDSPLSASSPPSPLPSPPGTEDACERPLDGHLVARF